MEMIYSGASSHAKIDEYSVSDKNKSPKTKKRIIENVQETSAKAVVLNNRDVIIKQNQNKAQGKVEAKETPFQKPNLSPNSRYASQAAIQTSSNCYDAVIAPTTASLKMLKLLG
ncbi:20086_t:CDS:2 [Rhizophagus irregularis]|nr:20086_t:CDS:2 [Rhizophagus irregularis]